MGAGNRQHPDGLAARPTRVLIAEDDPRFRALLGELIAEDPSLRLVGSAGDAGEAVALAEREGPDVAVVDVRMPAGGGVTATEGIRARSPGTRVVALTAHVEPSVVLSMLRAGAVGYVVKGSAPDQLLAAVRAAANGEALSGAVARDLVRELADGLERRRRHDAEFGRRERRIRTAMAGGRPVAVFQPVVRLEDGEVVGVEALARFDAALTESPREWFEDADSVDLRVELELAAVRAAAAGAAELDPAVWISLNVSPETALHPERLLETLAGLEQRQLVVEITEQAPVEDYDELNAALRHLRDAGVRLAVDDAGAGYASLRHILRLEPDIIKLDRSLVLDVHRDRARRALATALISFASEIGATIVAEGIETGADLEALRHLGVTFGQGYHLARPHPPPVEALVAVA